MDYIGSKLSLLNFIDDVFNEEVSDLGIKVNNITDIFCWNFCSWKTF